MNTYTHPISTPSGKTLATGGRSRQPTHHLQPTSPLQEFADNSPQCRQMAWLKALVNDYAFQQLPVQKRSVIVDSLPGGNKASTHGSVKAAIPAHRVGTGIEKSEGFQPVSGIERPLGAPVQRKIGFEFQAYDSVTFQSEDDYVVEEVGEHINEEFMVESDTGARENELEIITEPVDETLQGRQRLAAQMDDIRTLASGIVHGSKVSDLCPDIVQWENEAQDYYFAVNQAVHFHPQATVGVKFGKIADLMDYLTSAPSLSGAGIPPEDEHQPVDQKARLAQVFGWSGKDDQQNFKVAWSVGVKKARQLLAGTGASPSAVDFAAFLCGFAEYAATGDQPDPMHQDAEILLKYYMPFMPRLGLLPHYKKLEMPDRHVLNSLPAYILDRNFFPAGMNEHNVLLNLNFTIRDLLNGLAAGKTLTEMLSSYQVRLSGYEEKHFHDFDMVHDTDIGPSDREPAIPQATVPYYSPVYLLHRFFDASGHPHDLLFVHQGGYSDVFDDYHNRMGAILELRKLGSEVRPEHLKDFALAVFDFIGLINEG